MTVLVSVLFDLLVTVLVLPESSVFVYVLLSVLFDLLVTVLVLPESSVTLTFLVFVLLSVLLDLLVTVLVLLSVTVLVLVPVSPSPVVWVIWPLAAMAALLSIRVMAEARSVFFIEPPKVDCVDVTNRLHVKCVTAPRQATACRVPTSSRNVRKDMRPGAEGGAPGAALPPVRLPGVGQPAALSHPRDRAGAMAPARGRGRPLGWATACGFAGVSAA